MAFEGNAARDQWMEDRLATPIEGDYWSCRNKHEHCRYQGYMPTAGKRK
jgi:hypothetical protein